MSRIPQIEPARLYAVPTLVAQPAPVEPAPVEFEPYYFAEPAPAAAKRAVEIRLSALDLMYAYYDAA
jgi:hypothetical protein